MPPSKRFRDMDQLSGGEKTIAALALIFALHACVFFSPRNSFSPCCYCVGGGGQWSVVGAEYGARNTGEMRLS